MRHIFYVPASYAACLYSLLAGSGLLLCLYIGLLQHPREILMTSCGSNHYEFCPSISTVIGDRMPERQIWRVFFIICAPFRVGASVTLFNVFWQKGTGGMSELYTVLHSPRQLVRSTVFLVLLALAFDLARLLGAVVWTMVASAESLSYHNLGFAPYVFFCFCMQATINEVVRRNRFNLGIYPVQRDAIVSYRAKRIFFWVESVAAVGVTVFYLRHYMTCAPASFSLSTMHEWVFATSNVAYDGVMWYELKTQGWWLSGSPAFVARLWRNAGTKSHRDGFDAATGLFADLKPSTSNTALAGDGSLRGNSRNVPDSALVAEQSSGANVDGGRTVGREKGEDGSAHVVRVPVESSSVEAATHYAGAATPQDGARLDLADVDVVEDGIFGADTVLHKFTFCCAPFALSMWLCDVYWYYMLIEMTVNFVQHMYFMPMVAMSVSWEMASLVALVSPCLLRVKSFRRWATGPCYGARSLLLPSPTHRRLAPMYLLFYFIAALSHMGMLLNSDPRRKILVSSIGPCFVSLALFSHKLYPAPCVVRGADAPDTESTRRHIFAPVLAVIACMLLRILYISHSPVFVEPFYNAVFGLSLGLVFTFFIYRHLMFAPDTVSAPSAVGRHADDHALDHPDLDVDADHVVVVVAANHLDKSASDKAVVGAGRTASTPNSIAALALAIPPTPSWLLGLLLGFATALTMNVYNSANILPRFLAIDPYPASLAVVGAFALGVLHSTDVLLIAPHLLSPSEAHVGVVGRVLRRYLRHQWRRVGLLLLFSCLVLLYGTRQTNFTYEKRHAHYPTTPHTPRDAVRIADWGVQENFAGNKYVAFAGALVMTFVLGALAPIVTEVALAHPYHRRLARLAQPNVYAGEGHLVTSLELWWGMTMLGLSLVYALCTSYPFVPLAWLVREQSRPLILLNVMGLYALTMIATRHARALRPGTAATARPTTAARRQRSLHGLSGLLLFLAFVVVVVGRESFRARDVSYPAGRDTAVRLAPQVAAVHEELVRLLVRRNGATDRWMKDYERDYLLRRVDDERRNLEWRVKEDAEYDVMKGLHRKERDEVWQAAEAMSVFTGMIWTVHFAFDNNNVDSFTRMVNQIRNTGAGVIGLLESDTMHLVNGNRDMVEYISYYNGYRYTDYGPTSLDNTYGCALISRYPIKRVRRYVSPSPLGELSCLIHAQIDVFGLTMQIYVGHFGNTEHWADGLLQSQFLGQLVLHNPGPSAWFGYLVTYPGDREHYAQYTSPTERGKFRDAGLELYVRRPWVWLKERGGYAETPSPTATPDPNIAVDFDTDKKLGYVGYLEGSFPTDPTFRRPPPDKPRRHFYYNATNRYAETHPRFEFIDRYCQYLMYKTGREEDELEQYATKLQSPFTVDLFDWWRVLEGEVSQLSDTEIQVMQLRFKLRKPAA